MNARGILSAAYQVLAMLRGGGTQSQVRGGGFPVPGLRGVPDPRSGGTWSQVRGGVPGPMSGGGYPVPGPGGYPIPGRGYPVPGLGEGGTLGTPLSRPGMGAPPSQTWDGVPLPPARPGMGYPLPSHTSVDRHTDWCQNITFPRTTYAGGKNCSDASCPCSSPACLKVKVHIVSKPKCTFIS